MRAELRHLLPALSHWFHLKPADLDDMTVGEIRTYVDAIPTEGPG